MSAIRAKREIIKQLEKRLALLEVMGLTEEAKKQKKFIKRIK